MSESNGTPDLTTQEEHQKAVREAIEREIASINKIAKDMNENPARVANALIMLGLMRQLAIVQNLLVQVLQAVQPPTKDKIVGLDGRGL
jgi:hypothetical protein